MSVILSRAALYVGRVTHTRLKPFQHKLDYRVFSMLLDIDAVNETAKHTSLFSYNRWGLAAFFDCDHGDRDGSPLRSWVERTLHQGGIEVPVGSVQLLCFPRILGYVFNPLSVYFCHDTQQRLCAIIYEVHNTVGGAHAYVVPVDPESGQPGIHQSADKVFYVSPFMGMTGRYDFDVVPPSERFSVCIRESAPEGLLLIAKHHGERRPFNDRQLAWLLLMHPLMTIKVFGGILWEALRIWIKGGQYHAPVQTQGPNVTRGWLRGGPASISDAAE